MSELDNDLNDIANLDLNPPPPPEDDEEENNNATTLPPPPIITTPPVFIPPPALQLPPPPNFDDDDEEEEEDDDDVSTPLSPPTLNFPPPLGLPSLPPLPDSIANSNGATTNTSMKLEAKLFLKSMTGLSWKGWKLCNIAMQGEIIHYTREESTVNGNIDLAGLKHVGFKGIKDVPENGKAFLLTVGETKYAFYTEDETTFIVWTGVFRNLRKTLRVRNGEPPKKKKPSGSVSSRAKSKKLKKSSGPQIELVKQRMGDLGKEINKPTYRFLQLLYDARPTFINAIFTITQQADSDKVALYLARIFYFVDRALHLIRVVIMHEIENTTAANNLFRQNSLASKMMTAYSRLIAQDYLTELLKPIVEKVIGLAKKLEVDPAKLNDEEKLAIKDNIQNVKDVVDELLKAIANSITSVPVECRQICNMLRDECQKKFPDAVNISIAGYLFLRLINPALVVPDGIGIVSPTKLTAEGRRALVIVSKVVLNMANQVEFKKEEYMLEFNSFVQEKFETMKQFYAECANVPDKATIKQHDAIKVEPIAFLEEVGRLYKILHSNSAKLIETLGETSPLAIEFKACIDGIGPPDAQPQLNKSSPSPGSSSLANRTKSLSVLDKIKEGISHFFKSKEEKEAKEKKKKEKEAAEKRTTKD